MLRLGSLLTALVSLVTLSGCYGVVPAPRSTEPVAIQRPGPPPHAPAHGYRRTHESGAGLRFDWQLGVYVVAGHSGVYFHEGWFLRFRGDTWQVSVSLAGPWQQKRTVSIPPGLRSKHHAKKLKHRGRSPAKGAW